MVDISSKKIAMKVYMHKSERKQLKLPRLNLSQQPKHNLFQ